MKKSNENWELRPREQARFLAAAMSEEYTYIIPDLYICTGRFLWCKSKNIARGLPD